MDLRRLVPLTLLVLASVLSSRNPVFAAGPTTLTGTLADGATYKIEVPANWNGTLVLYSHGYVVPGTPNPAQDVGDPLTGDWLRSHGYALAGSSYSTTGWAIEQAFQDQTALLDYFTARVGKPQQTIAWGHSLGGIITAGLVQDFPDRFSAALPMCGVLAGGVGIWNEGLDGAFAFKTLVAPNTGLQVVHSTSPGANLGIAEGALLAAQATPQGRARLALVAALSDVPGWYAPTSSEPARNDYTAQEQNQFLWEQQVDFPFAFAFRSELERRAGGNPSWNTGVDYRSQLKRSIDHHEVEALYRQAGLDLNTDLQALNKATRVAADPAAVSYLSRYIIFNGQIHIPVLTMHTTGDGLVPVQDEQAYKQVVHKAGNGAFLRQTFVHRANHCSFTPAETIAAFQTLIDRLDTGHWGDTSAQALDRRAADVGAQYNVFGGSSGVVPTAPAFIPYHPAVFLRPYDSLSTRS